MVGKFVWESHNNGFGFTSDWLRKWCEFFKPITKCSDVKPMEVQIAFDSQLKPALKTVFEKLFLLLLY